MRSFFFTNFKFVHQAGENIFKNSLLNIDSVLDFRYLSICLHLTLIIHAGDIGNTDVLIELEFIAPVVAVRGNMDVIGGLRDLPETEAVEIGDVLLYVIA
ncbi:MAG: metallophosphoesterase family protein [Desulfobacterales bacterium]